MTPDGPIRGSGPRSSERDRRRRRSYLRRFVPGMVAFVASIALVDTLTGAETANRWLWYVLPVVALVWIAYAIARDVLAADDYQRQLMATSMAVGFGAAMLAAATVGLLDAGEFDVPGAGWIVFGVGGAAWAVHGAATDAAHR